MVSKKEITTFQLIFLLIHSQVGTGIVTLPLDVFIKAKGDAWISVLFTGIIIQTLILLFGVLMQRFPSKNLFDIAQVLFGKIIGKGIIILYSMYFIFVGSIVLAKFSYFLKAWMLPVTPRWVLLALLSLTAIFIVKDNLQVIVRFAVLSSIIFIGFISAAIYALKFANVTYILPVAENGVLPIIQGLPPSLYSFQGFEILLIVYPFVQSNNKDVLKAATIANIFVTFFYAFLVIVNLLFYSPKDLKLAPEPVLYMVKSLSFKIIERPDLFFTSMWIVLVTTTLTSILYASTLGLSMVMNSDKLTKYAVMATIACFLLGMSLQDLYVIESASKIFNQIMIPIFWGFPILLLLISIIFRKKEEVRGG